MQSLILDFRKYLDDSLSHLMSLLLFLSGPCTPSWVLWSRGGSSGDNHSFFFLALLQLITVWGKKHLEGSISPPSYKTTWAGVVTFPETKTFSPVLPNWPRSPCRRTCLIIWHLKLSKRKEKLVSRSLVYIFLRIQHCFSHGISF